MICYIIVDNDGYWQLAHSTSQYTIHCGYNDLQTGNSILLYRGSYLDAGLDSRQRADFMNAHEPKQAKSSRGRRKSPDRAC